MYLLEKHRQMQQQITKLSQSYQLYTQTEIVTQSRESIYIYYKS